MQLSPLWLPVPRHKADTTEDRKWGPRSRPLPIVSRVETWDGSQYRSTVRDDPLSDDKVESPGFRPEERDPQVPPAVLDLGEPHGTQDPSPGVGRNLRTSPNTRGTPIPRRTLPPLSRPGRRRTLGHLGRPGSTEGPVSR